MTFRTPRAPAGLRQRPRWLVPTVVSVVALLVAVGVFTSVWTDVLWYQAVDYVSVYATRVRARVVLFLVGGSVMAAAVGASIVLAYRMRPPYRAMTPEQQGLEQYRTLLEPRLRLVLGAIVALVGLITGLAVEGRWQTWLLYLNRQPFGVQDPLFGRDISYFVFTYPFLRLVVGYAFAVVVVSFIAAAATHYLYGGIRLQSQEDKISPAARAQLSVLLGVFVLFKAWAYWLDRYGLVFSQRGQDNGAWYTDVNAVLPAKTILTVIAVVCAGLFFAAVVRRGILLPAAALGMLVLSAILIGGVYPAIVQRFQVQPTELAKEEPYIKRNIQATRQAFSVDDVKITGYNATTDPSEAAAAVRGGPIPGIRLMDPSVVPPTFQQLQQIRGFYNFTDPLDIGRYTLDGQTKATVVAVRGLEGPPQGRGNWVNSHLVYTHGFGFVAANASTVRQGGAPEFVASDIPPQGQLGDFEPRVYFGQIVPNYSIVGGSKNAAIQELDYPDESADGQQSNVYSGTGGVPIGSPLRKLVYALAFQDANIFLSDAVNDDSRLMYIREPRQRIQRVAPFLEFDGNPYPAIVDGRIKWIIDAYTTTQMYPYSTRYALEQATQDTTTRGPAVAAQPEKQVNYIRNSVKAVVDAYSGEVTLYQWNERDPMLRAWTQAFPGLFAPRSAISDALMEHLRYPEDLFKVQRQVLARYHVTQATAFYSGQDFWQVPDDPTGSGQSLSQPPYYLMLQMPGEQQPTYSLTTTFVPRDRPNLAAFMAVDSSPGRNYGQLRILRLPRSTSIAGPGQMQNDFKSDARVRQDLALLEQGGAQVVYGNLLTLPVGGGLLYVEPVYVQASAGQSYPLLQRVLVSFGGRIGYAPTLEEALAEVFPGGSSAEGQAPSGQQQQPERGQQQPQQPPPAGEQASPELRAALEDARQAYQDAQQALRQGNFQAYGEAQQRLKQALDRALQIQNSSSAASTSASNGSGAPAGG